MSSATENDVTGNASSDAEQDDAMDSAPADTNNSATTKAGRKKPKHSGNEMGIYLRKKTTAGYLRKAVHKGRTQDDVHMAVQVILNTAMLELVQATTDVARASKAKVIKSAHVNRAVKSSADADTKTIYEDAEAIGVPAQGMAVDPQYMHNLQVATENRKRLFDLKRAQEALKAKQEQSDSASSDSSDDDDDDEQEQEEEDKKPVIRAEVRPAGRPKRAATVKAQ